MVHTPCDNKPIDPISLDEAIRSSQAYINKK